MANDSINKGYIEQFESNFRHAFQQQQSRLLSCCTVEPLTGYTHYFEKLGEASASAEASTQTTETPNIDPVHTKRQVQSLSADWGTMAPNTDVERMLINPKSAYVRQGVMALKRQIDDWIIAGATAAAIDIDISADKSTDVTTSVALPAGQIIDADDTGLQGFTLDKWLNAKELMDAAEVPDEGRYFVLGSRQLRQALDMTEVGSADYNTVRALVNGDLDTFLGFKVIRSERLATPTANDRRCLAFHRDAIGVAMNKETFVRVAEDPMRRFNTRVYVRTHGNAVRIWDDGVVAVDCYEAP